MNVVIPMAGLGSRFPKDKYPQPKPLIDIFGKPMIQWAIESLGIDGQYIFIIRDDFPAIVVDKLKELKPDCKIISLSETTEGPACTCLLAGEYINNEESLIIANCDQILLWDVDQFKNLIKPETKGKYDGIVVTYNTQKPMNSYVEIDGRGVATRFAEKEVISNLSLNGVHFWQQGQDFVWAAKEMIKNNRRAPNGEFYISLSYNELVKVGKWIIPHHVPIEQHWAVGLPEDLEKFKEYYANYQNIGHA